jgi:hypothetical protein
MPGPNQILDRIRAAMAEPQSARPDALKDAAVQYAAACRDANERLGQCGGLIRRGKRAEGIRLAETPPNLLRLAAALSIAEFESWDRFCETHGLERPPKLLGNAAAELKQAYADEQQVRELQSRRTAMGRPPGEASPAPRLAGSPPRTLTARKAAPAAVVPPPLPPAEAPAVPAKAPPAVVPTSSAPPPPLETAPTPAPRNTLLWVGAFIWPLLVIPAVVAWHLSTQQQQPRANPVPDLTAKLADSEARAETLAKELTASETDAAGLRTELSKATTRLAEQEQDREQTRRDLERSADTIAGLKQDNLRQMDQIQSLRNSINVAQAAPQRFNSFVPPPTPFRNMPGEATFAINDFTNSNSVLMNPPPACDHLELLNPLADKRLSSFENKTADGVQLEVRFSAETSGPTTAPTRPPVLLGTVELDRARGLVWVPGPAGATTQPSRPQVEDLLRGCGVALHSNGRVVSRIQFGESETAMSLLQGGSLQVVPTGRQLPPLAQMDAKCDDQDWMMTASPDGTELDFACRSQNVPGFTITLDLQTGEIRSDFNIKRAAAASALDNARQALIADTAEQAAARQKMQDTRLLTDARIRAGAIQVASAARMAADQAVGNDRRTVAAATFNLQRYTAFASCKILVVDRNTRMVLKSISVSK